MSPESIRYEWVGDCCLRLEFVSSSKSRVLGDVHTALAAVDRAALQGIEDLTPGFSTLHITFGPLNLVHAAAEDRVRHAVAAGCGDQIAVPSREIEMPACYHETLAPDLSDVARLCKLNPEEVISLHSTAEYTVAFIGFSPGFPYLIGLPQALQVPRLASPRAQVPSGSIAIAADQAGIYPGHSPGGWRLIGRTPLILFDPFRDPPCALRGGDRIRFVPISLAEYTEQTGAGEHS